MMHNRAMPSATVVPVLADGDVIATCEWLCSAFGFSLRWRAGSHRAQLNVGDGCVIVAEGEASARGASIMVRVEDADAHCETARAFGARILSPPADYPYGERQYSAADPAGRVWTFSQSIADVDPGTWGAEVGRL